MKTIIDLPNDMVREIKIRAVSEGRKLKKVVTDLRRFGMEQGVSLLPAPKKGKVVLPLFQCSPNAPTSRMGIDALIALEQESQREASHGWRG
jgi:hypothetical protein